MLFLWIIRFLNWEHEHRNEKKKHYTYKVWPKYSSHFKIGYIFCCFIWVYFCATYNKCSEFVIKLRFLHDYWHVYWQRCNAFTWTKTTKKKPTVERKKFFLLFCAVQWKSDWWISMGKWTESIIWSSIFWLTYVLHTNEWKISTGK